jgi:hypothetical protein
LLKTEHQKFIRHHLNLHNKELSIDLCDENGVSAGSVPVANACLAHPKIDCVITELGRDDKKLRPFADAGITVL